MSDNLFAYFLLNKEYEADLETVAVKEVIYDLISDQIAILHQEHFRVHISGELPETYINVNLEELGRVFDNVMSNLLKYADPEEKSVSRLYRIKRYLRSMLAIRLNLQI